jgi:hypothetical protein
MPLWVGTFEGFQVVVAAADFVSANSQRFKKTSNFKKKLVQLLLFKRTNRRQPGSLLSSMASPRLSTRHFGIRKPAEVWTDAAPRHSPPFGPGA